MQALCLTNSIISIDIPLKTEGGTVSDRNEHKNHSHPNQARIVDPNRTQPLEICCDYK